MFCAELQPPGRGFVWKNAGSQLEIGRPCYYRCMKRARKKLKKMTPRKETLRQMRPIRRAAFMAILAEAIKTPSPKPVRKSS